jgi:hypothetical protein
VESVNPKFNFLIEKWNFLLWNLPFKKDNSVLELNNQNLPKIAGIDKT